MRKNSKRGLRIIAGISTVILMSPLFANSSVQVMLGNELNAHADTNAKTPEGDKSVHKAFTPKRKSQHAVDSSVTYSHKVPVLKVSLKPTSVNYFKKGDQIHFKFSSKNVNLKNLKASYQKSLPFSYKKVNDHELVLTFKKSLNSGLYGQAYAIPTKNKKMTTKVSGTFDNAKLDIKNGNIHSYKLTSKAHKASSNAESQQNTANQESTSNATTQQQQSTSTSSQATNNTGTTTGTQQTATSNSGTTTGTQQTASSQQAQQSSTTNATTSSSKQSSASQSASNSGNQSYVSTQGKAVAKTSTGGTTSTEANQPQASKVDSSSTASAQTTDATSSSDQTQAQSQSTSTSSDQTTTQASDTTADSSADSQAASTDNSNVTTNSDGSISQSQQQNVSATDAYNAALSRTTIKQGSSTKGYVSTPVPSASDPETTYNKYAQQDTTSTTGSTSDSTTNSSTSSTTTATDSTNTDSTNQSSQTSTTPTTAQANSTGTVSTAADSQTTSTATDTTTIADSTNTSEENSEGSAIYNAVKKNVSDQTSTWASANEQGEIIKEYPWILKDISSKMAANQDTKGQVWKYAVPLTTGKTVLVTIDGRSSKLKADEGTLAVSMPSLLKSLGSSSKTGMFDEAVDIDVLKQSDYYKNLQTEQNNLKNASSTDAYNAVLSSTTFSQDNGTLDTSKYTVAPTPDASDPEATYAKLAADQSSSSNSSTSTTEDSDSTAIFNNIKLQVANQTKSWASSIEQGEIIKDYPWILNDIAKKMAVAGADDNQVWNYKILLTTGKTALVTINGQADATNPSSLTASMPQLLKSLGSSATPGMFDDAVDSDVLKNSQYYKDLQEQSDEQAHASTSSSTSSTTSDSGIFGSLLSSIVSSISFISGLTSTVQTVATIGALSVIPVVVSVASVVSSAVSSVTNIINTTNSIVSIAQKIAPIVAPLFIIPAITTIAGIVLNLPLIVLGLTIAKPVLDTIGTVMTISGIVTAFNTVNTISKIVSTVGTIGSAIVLGTTIGAIGTAVAVGALLSTVLPVIFNTISGIANAVSFLSKAVAFVSGMVLGTVNALTSAVSILGKVIFALPTLGTVSSLFNTVLSVAGSIAFSVLAGTLANISTGFSNVPLLAGFAIGASLVSLILTELGRQLINSVTSAINKFIESAKNVMNILALGSIIPAFVLAPTLIKIAMAFLALIPLAGWALKKFFDNIKAGLNTLKQFINGVVIALPLTAINTAIASTVTSIVNNAGSLVSTTLGPLAVRLVVGALTLATLPITFMLIGLPFVFINIVNRLFKDLVTGTVKLVADVASLAANVVTNIENQIQQVIKTVVSPVVNGVNFLSSLLFIIPALTGIKYLTFPLAAIISLPLSVIANILVPGLATNVAKVVIPAITGLLFIPTLAANIAGGRVLTYFLGLPVALILGNALGNLLGQIVGSLTTALRNGVRGIINLLISPLSFISNILGLIPVVNILTLPLRIATSILTIGNNIAQVINPIVDAVTGGLNSLVARLLFAPVALVGELFFGLPTIVNLAGLPILITSIGKTISSLSSLNTKIIDWMTSAIQNALKSLTFNTIFNQALQSLIGLPVLLLTSPIWVGLPLATLFINTLGNVIVPLLKFVNNSILLPALQLLTKIAAPIIADVLTFIPQLMAFANSLKTAFTTFFTVAVPQLIGAFVLPQILINGLSLLGGTINTLVQMIGVGISSFVNKLLFNIANGIISLVLNAASLLTTLDGLGNLANAVSGLLFGIPALLALLSAGSLLSLPLTFAITSLINSFITKVVLPLISSLITNPLAIILSTIGNTISDLIKLSNPLLAVLLFLPTLLINAVKSLIGNNLLSSIINGLGNLLTSLSYIPLILSGLLNGLLLGFLALTQPLWIGLPLLNLLRVIASDVVLPILSLINTLSLPGTLISTLWNVFVAPLLKTLPAQIISGLIFAILGLPLGILGSVAGAIFGSILPQIIAGVLSFLTSLPASLLSGILSAISTISNVLGTIGDFISGLSALGNVILNVLGNLLNPLNLLNSTFIKGFITLAGDIGRFLSDILFKLPVQALLNSVLPALVQFGTSLIMPVISGLVGLPISMFISTIFSRLVSSLLNLPLLLLGNDLLSWLPALLAGAIVQLGSLLKNGLPTILGAMILFGLPAVLLPLEILTSLLMSLLLPTGLKWLAALPIIIPALLTIGSQIKWVIDAISAVFNTIISTIKAVISNHEFLVNITTIPTIIGAILNTVFNNGIANLISDFLSTLGKLNWNNFITPIIVSGIAKTIATALTDILNFIGNIVNTIISNILKGLFNLQGISGLLGLLFDIPAAILQGILNNVIPDIVGAIAGLLAFAFNFLISTPLMLLGMIASALGRLVLTNLLNPILQFGIDLISWIPALLLGTLVNIFNLINGLLTQGPIGLLLFGLPLLLNLGLLFANLLAIPGFILNLIGNLFGLQNILSTIFPLIAAILLGAGLTIVSGITNGLNIVSLAGQLLLSILTAPLWIGIPALNLIRQITFWTTALLGLPQAILSFLGTIASSILKSIWTGLTSLPQQLLNLALSLLSDIFNTIVKDALSAIGAGITGLLVLGGLNLAGNVIKTLLQLAQFFLVTLPLTIGGLILSILALSLINSLIVSGLKSLLNSFLNGLVSTITSVLSALPGLASQFIANTIGTFALAAVLTLDLFTGLQKLGNRLVMSFILGFLNLLNSAVKAVAGLPTLLGVLGTIVAAILPVPGHLLLAALLGALTLGSLIAQLAELPLSLLIDALTFINNINNVLSIVSAIASLIGALVISQIVSGIAKLLLTPLAWLAGLITGLIGTVLNAIKGVIETVVPIVLGVIGSILSIAVPVAALIFNTIASILKDNPLLALLVFALPGLIIPALDAAMLSQALSAISGILKALWNLLTNPIGTILDIISSILNPFSSANIFKTILGILATLAALPVVIGLAKILSSIQNLINGPLQFIENLIGTVLSSIASGLIRLISNGLSLAGLKLLTDLLPKALLALFTLLVPVVNIFTIGSAITAALNDIPLAIIEKLASDLIASLIGNLVKGLLNVLGDLVSAIATFVGLFTVFLPLAGILVLTLVPASLILLWFFGPIVLQLMVNPIADLVAFMVLQYTMFNHTIFYLAFFWIFEPLTFLTFIGSFVNWLNPLNALFNGISSFAKNILPTLTNLGFTVIDLVALNTFLKGGVVGLQGALTLIGAALGLKLLIGIYSIANLIPVIGLWLVVIPLVLVIVVIGVLGVIANLGINVPTFLSFEIAVPFVTALAIFVTLVGMQIALMIDGLTTSIFLPGIVQNLASGLFTSFLTDPIFTLLATFAFASLGFASLLALPAGLIMLAHDWLPNTFNIPTFIYFLIMTSPIWTVGNWDGLFPIIGWIPAIIDDIGYFLIGAWGTGLITSLNFSLWLLTNIPLVFSVVVPIAMLLALGSTAFLLAPVGLIGGAIISLVNAIGPVINAITSFIGSLVTGISA
ncbi:hypothetical protein, partial [Lentilactobacillus sunkii]|uniref:hypothetical protein n=1 Tax=Lentilactobacillus sunkii TaxID=481719 RepID=UPI000A846FFD